MLQILISLLQYKAWANQELFAVLAQAPELHADRHTAIRLLNHVYVTDRIFESNLQGLRHGYTALNTPDTPQLSDLQGAVLGLDQWYLAYVQTTTDASLGEALDFAFVDGKPGRMTRAEMLMHILTHGNYHRGMVGELLVRMGMKPPSDTFTVFLHRMR